MEEDNPETLTSSMSTLIDQVKINAETLKDFTRTLELLTKVIRWATPIVTLVMGGFLTTIVAIEILQFQKHDELKDDLGTIQGLVNSNAGQIKVLLTNQQLGTNYVANNTDAIAPNLDDKPAIDFPSDRMMVDRDFEVHGKSPYLESGFPYVVVASLDNPEEEGYVNINNPVQIFKDRTFVGHGMFGSDKKGFNERFKVRVIVTPTRLLRGRVKQSDIENYVSSKPVVVIRRNDLSWDKRDYSASKIRINTPFDDSETFGNFTVKGTVSDPHIAIWIVVYLAKGQNPNYYIASRARVINDGSWFAPVNLDIAHAKSGDVFIVTAIGNPISKLEERTMKEGEFPESKVSSTPIKVTFKQ